MKLDSDQYSGELPTEMIGNQRSIQRLPYSKDTCKGTVDIWLIPSGFLHYLSISGEYMQAQSNKYSSF
jgi:hypothetical protein